MAALDDAGRSLTFRIDSIEADPRDREGEVFLYGLSVREPGSPHFVDYCAPDAEGRSRAIPLQGSWTAAGAPSAASDKLTFACTSGAIGKCVRMGYKPWKTVAGQSLAPLHAACVRLVRADYCGDGRSHTRDGTRIDIWDRLGVQAREPREGKPEIFEAACAPTGAVWLNVPRWQDAVDGVIAECPEPLRGRTSKDAPLGAAEVARRYPEALLFNARYVRAEDRMEPRAPSRR